MKVPKFIIPAIVLIGVFIFQSLFIVQEINQAILLQFIIEAVTLCIIGGIAGVILGSGLYFIIAMWQDWVFTIPFSAIFGSVTFSACVGLFFGIWPAKKAAQLEPAVALRYE